MEILRDDTWNAISAIATLLALFIVIFPTASKCLGDWLSRVVRSRQAWTIPFGGITLVLPGRLIYRISIEVASPSNDIPSLVMVSTASSTILGLTWGVFWSLLILPFLVKAVKGERS
jgi:hypothetical protein